MLSRFILNPSRQLRHHFTLNYSPHFHSFDSIFKTLAPLSQNPNFSITQLLIRHFSSSNDDSGRNGGKPTSDFWKIGQESDNFGDVFGNGDGGRKLNESSWGANEGGGDLFGGIKEEDKEKESGGSAGDWLMEGFKLGGEKKVEDVFDLRGIGGVAEGGRDFEKGLEEEKEKGKAVDEEELRKEEENLLGVLKGPNRAFGDLVAASGITDAMLDSLIALKDLSGVEGLPPLMEIEDKRYENSFKKSSRYELELQKQEEAAKSRVRRVDEKGRAYGTGRRKCSIARVWIQPGEGQFIVNDKEFDVYFPMLDHRAALLQPFSETQTLGLWDIKCTVKGGGVSGQVGAIQLGVSRALQNWEPGLRPPLRGGGFLTRDPRVVERKKPGKAKARKSFQWVKR